MPRDSGSQERKEEISPLSLIGLPPAACARSGKGRNGPCGSLFSIDAMAACLRFVILLKYRDYEVSIIVQLETSMNIVQCDRLLPIEIDTFFQII